MHHSRGDASRYPLMLLLARYASADLRFRCGGRSPRMHVCRLIPLLLLQRLLLLSLPILDLESSMRAETVGPIRGVRTGEQRIRADRCGGLREGRIGGCARRRGHRRSEADHRREVGALPLALLHRMEVGLLGHLRIMSPVHGIDERYHARRDDHEGDQRCICTTIECQSTECRIGATAATRWFDRRTRHCYARTLCRRILPARI
jgi:hypothetical protein